MDGSADPVSEIYRIERKDDADVFEIRGIIHKTVMQVHYNAVCLPLLQAVSGFFLTPAVFQDSP